MLCACLRLFWFLNTEINRICANSAYTQHIHWKIYHATCRTFTDDHCNRRAVPMSGRRTPRWGSARASGRRGARRRGTAASTALRTWAASSTGRAPSPRCRSCSRRTATGWPAPTCTLQRRAALPPPPQRAARPRPGATEAAPPLLLSQEEPFFLLPGSGCVAAWPEAQAEAKRTRAGFCLMRFLLFPSVFLACCRYVSRSYSTFLGPNPFYGKSQAHRQTRAELQGQWLLQGPRPGADETQGCSWARRMSCWIMSVFAVARPETVLHIGCCSLLQIP